MPSRTKEDLRKIRQSFQRASGQPTTEEREAAEQDAYTREQEEMDAKEQESDEDELAADAPIKDKITRSILRILKKRGAPE